MVKKYLFDYIMTTIDLNKEIKNSILNKDTMRTDVLRNVKSMFTKFEKEGKTLTAVDETQLLMKIKRQYEDSIAQFKKGRRNDLVDKETAELDILLEYIPDIPTDEDIQAYTQFLIDNLKGEGKEISMKIMKELLSNVQMKYPTANGSIVSCVLKKNF